MEDVAEEVCLILKDMFIFYHNKLMYLKMNLKWIYYIIKNYFNKVLIIDLMMYIKNLLMIKQLPIINFN